MPVRRNIRLLFAPLALLCAATTVVAADPPGQLFFTALLSPKQSMIGINGQPNSVYLAWDTVEGELPAGIGNFFLLRDGALLATLPATPMTAIEIDALYTAPDQARREAEMVSWLDRELGGINPGNFASALHDKLTGDFQSNALWLKFGSRMDFNLAQARRRAYRDDNAPVNPAVNYELVADFAPFGGSPGPEDKRLGELDVNTGQSAHVLPRADDLRQVLLSRCDAPEEGKDQAAVALSWNTPEAQVDEYRNALLIAGYDVYRQASCDTSVPPVGVGYIRGLAATAAQDAAGQPLLPGLERVNELPVVISGGGHGETEQRYQGFNAPYAQFTETPQQVAAAGLKPGDRCMYYVVPRDITGNYGNTAEVAVTIPDLQPPPAPWVIEIHSDTVHGGLDPHNNDELDITFDHVNVHNYYTDHQADRVYCNLDTAAAEKELRYVSQGENCDTGIQHRVRLDIKGYNIYRFREPSIANNFQDTDGDGYGDLDERVPHPDGIPNITLPGTACDKNLKTGTYRRIDPEAENRPFTIPASSPYLQQRDDGRWVIEFGDPVPAQGLLEQTWWYRIQTVHEDDTLSELSAPQRGLFHKVLPPSRDDIDCSYGERRCARFAVQAPFNEAYFAEDLTPAAAASWVRLSCAGQGQTQTLNLGIGPFTDADGNAHRVATLSNQACNSFVANQCSFAPVSATFLDAAGLALAPPIQVSGSAAPCPLSNVALVESCRQTVIDPLPRGPLGSARGPLTLDCPVPSNTCYRLYRDIGGKQHPLATLCDGDFPVCLDGYMIHSDGTIAECPPGPGTRVKLPNLSGEPICLSLSKVNENNVASAKLHLPCFKSAQVPPDKAQLLDFEFDMPGPDQGIISLVPPQMPIRGVLVQYYRDEPEAEPFTRTVFKALPDHSAADGPATLTAELATALNAGDPDREEQWCFRARTIGLAQPGEDKNVISGWAGPLCRVRRAPGQEPPDYMPWPTIPAIPEDSALLAEYLEADGLPVVHIGELNLPGQCPPPWGEGCSHKGTSAPCFPRDDNDRPLYDEPITFAAGSTQPACGNLCDNVADAIAGRVGFVAYRQERRAGGQASVFYQVSPLVPTAYCRYDFFASPSAPPVARVRDPLIKPMQIVSLGAPWNQPSMVFVDRYPHLEDMFYRYQFVYFDANGEPLRYRTSDWIYAVPGP